MFLPFDFDSRILAVALDGNDLHYLNVILPCPLIEGIEDGFLVVVDVALGPHVGGLLWGSAEERDRHDERAGKGAALGLTNGTKGCLGLLPETLIGLPVVGTPPRNPWS
jgi:hypothetical protein